MATAPSILVNPQTVITEDIPIKEFMELVNENLHGQIARTLQAGNGVFHRDGSITVEIDSPKKSYTLSKKWVLMCLLSLQVVDFESVLSRIKTLTLEKFQGVLPEAPVVPAPT